MVKIYMDGPGGSKDAPFTVDELRAAVTAVHARRARVTCHATYLDGTRVCAEAGVDSIQHGFQVDDATAATMARNGVALVSTLSIFPSWDSFARTTTLERFVTAEGRARGAKRKPGMPADLVLVHGDPLSDPRALWRVWAVYQRGQRVA